MISVDWATGLVTVCSFDPQVEQNMLPGGFLAEQCQQIICCNPWLSFALTCWFGSAGLAEGLRDEGDGVNDGWEFVYNGLNPFNGPLFELP